jgi:hypothetical protein
MQRLFVTLVTSVLFLAGTSMSGQEYTCVSVDFDNYTAGTVLSNQDTNFEVTVNSNGSVDQAMIFDSANPTGGDADLGTPNQVFGGPGIGNGGESDPGVNDIYLGNLLIISEDGDSNDPDDEASGGQIIFTFNYPVKIDEITFVDIEENEAAVSIELYDDRDDPINSYMSIGYGNNSVETISMGDEDITTVVFNFGKSGAIANFEYCIPSQLLPVTITDLKVEERNDLHHLSWRTHDEIDIHHYEVEYAINQDAALGKWRKIASLESGFDYYEQYITPDRGVNYYRLKIVELDGLEYYSDIVSLDSNMSLNLFSEQSEIFDLLGRRYAHIDQLKPGVYIIRLHNKSYKVFIE